MRFLSRVTFSGVDKSCDLQSLADFAAEHPHCEFAVLANSGVEGTRPRYPSLDWIERLVHRLPKSQLAAHLCGSYAADLLKGKPKLPAFLTSEFARVQINLPDGLKYCPIGTENSFSSLKELDARLRETFHAQPEIIWQVRNFASAFLLNGLLAAGSGHNHISCLFDESGGTGRVSSVFPPISSIHKHTLLCGVGYAGGISPMNVAWMVQRIREHAFAYAGPKPEESLLLLRSTPVWIDMESGVRAQTDGLDQFSMSQCRRIMSVVTDSLLEKPCTSV